MATVRMLGARVAIFYGKGWRLLCFVGKETV